MYLVFLYPTCTYVPPIITVILQASQSTFSSEKADTAIWESQRGGGIYILLANLIDLWEKFEIPASLLWLVTKQCCVYLGVWWACFGALMDRNWFQVPDSSELCRLPGFAFEKLLYFLFAYMVLLFCSCTHPMQVRKAGGGAYWSPWWHQ